MRAQRVSRERAFARIISPKRRLDGRGQNQTGFEDRFFSSDFYHGTSARFQVYFPAGPCRLSTNSSANALSAGPTMLRWKFSDATGWRATPTLKRGAWRKASAAG